jgi:hypothetical protein
MNDNSAGTLFLESTDKDKGIDKNPAGEIKKKLSQSEMDKCMKDWRGKSTWDACVENKADEWFTFTSGAEKYCDEESADKCTKGVVPRKKSTLNAEAERKKKAQSEQSYLLQNLSTISKDRQTSDNPHESEFPNLILVNGVEGNLTNVMSCSRKLGPLLNASPLDLSTLMPSIRIFKKYLSAGPEHAAGQMDEFRFPDSLRISDLTSATSIYGSGVGLKSFEWKTTGTDAYTAPRTLMATLKLHFQTIDDLLPSDADQCDSAPKWVDLIIQKGRSDTAKIASQKCAFEESDVTAQVNKCEDTNPNFMDYTIVVEVGYVYASNNELTDELKDAVNTSRVTLALSLRSHRFSFRENGSIDLEIEYQAWYEGVTDTYKTDVFNLASNGTNPIAKKITKLENMKVQTQASISSPQGIACDIKQKEKDPNYRTDDDLEKEMKKVQEDIDKTIKEIDEQKKNLRASNYGAFIQHLIKKKALFSMTVRNSWYERGQLPKNRSASQTFGKKPVKRGYRRVYYFFLGDLINFISMALPNYGELTGSETNEAVDRNFEIVLGDMEYLDWKIFKKEVSAAPNFANLTLEQKNAIVSTSRRNENLAYLPISLDLYSIWFDKNVKNGDTVWTFHNYINALLDQLLKGTLQARGGDEIGTDAMRLYNERKRVRRGILSGRNSLLQRGKIISEPNSVVNSSGENRIFIDPTLNEEINTQYLVLSATSLPFSSTNIDEVENIKEGIYHLKIGTDAGIVKSIDFKRTDKAHIRDWNIMKAYNTGDTSVGAILEPYNATVRLFGSAFFQPGQYVYLNPATLGSADAYTRLSLARKLGLGGFYLITSVSTVIEEGKLETILDCAFEYYGNLPGQSPFGQATSTIWSTVAQAQDMSPHQDIENPPVSLEPNKRMLAGRIIPTAPSGLAGTGLGGGWGEGTVIG